MANGRKTGGARRWIGTVLMVWGLFVGIPAAICMIVTLFGGMEVDSFGEGAFLFFAFFVLNSVCMYMVVSGRRLIKGISRRIRGESEPEAQPRPEPVQPRPAAEKMQQAPVAVDGCSVHVSSGAFYTWLGAHPGGQYEQLGVMLLTEREPAITVLEDGKQLRAYRLQAEEGEDFTGKYFHYSVRLQMLGQSLVPAMQMDGFIADTPEERRIERSDVGYRMEGLILNCGGARAEILRERTRGQDLPAKGLKYPGYTTPSNIRLIGVCADCGQSFAFHGYAQYMAQMDAAYSDDGLDCCSIADPTIDTETWSYQEDGKTFRYYNAFCCPHCGAPYIDYRANPQMKRFGVSACVHLGRKLYEAHSETSV